MGHAVESRLLVEDVALCVHNNGAVHIVFNPVWPTSLVQSQVPVRPTHHVIIQVLKKKKGRQKYSPYQSFLVRFVLCKWVCAAGGLGVSHIYISKFLLGPQMSELRLHKKSQSAERKRPKNTSFSLFRCATGKFPQEECWQRAAPWRPALQRRGGGVKGWRVIHLEITHPFHWIHMSAPQQPG